jgi:hypothetical protein
MTCEIERPSPKTLFQSIMSMFSANVLGGAPVIPESNEWYVVSNDYAMAEEFYSFSEQAWKERDPRTCCCDNLINMAQLDGFYPDPAKFASGYIQLTGTPNAALPSSIEGVIAGQQYVNAGPMPGNLGSQGSAVVRMQALVPGAGGNTTSGATTGQLATTIPNVNQTFGVYGGQFCGGSEAEDCETFRQRYLDRMKYKPFLGLDTIKQTLLDWPCVTRVCERAGVCCEPGDVPDYAGGIDCQRPIRLYALFEGTFPCGAAPANTISEIQTWLFGDVQGVGQGLAPWGITGKVYPFTVSYVNIAIDGLACVPAGTTNIIQTRIKEFVARNCPSEILYVKDIETIVAQIMQSTNNFSVRIDKADPNDPNVSIDICGDAVPTCDVRLCLNNITFPNPVS